eukprot:10314737-Heterocapsa_arctica.AAC.1
MGVWLDLPSALRDGMAFHRSDTGTILTRGYDGIIPLRLIAEIRDLTNGLRLYPSHLSPAPPSVPQAPLART